MEKFMIFSKDELMGRADKAKKLMVKEGLDACIFSKSVNINYFSGYLTHLFESSFRPFFFILPANGGPCFVIPAFEAAAAIRNSWCENIRAWGTYDYCESSDPVEMLSITLKDMGLDKANIGIELDNGQRLGMTQQQLGSLQSLLPGLKLKSNQAVAWGCRKIKSPAEQEFLKIAGKASDLGAKRALEAVRVGATEKEIELAMCRGYIEGGAIPVFMTVTCGPERNAMPNPYASNNKVKYGDMLVMDYGCRYEMYMTDSTRVAFVGEASDRGKELFKAVVDIHSHVAAAVKPGEPICKLQEVCNKRMTELGLEKLWYHRAGHSIGLETQELPSIELGEQTIMEPGMVLAIEPAVYEYSTGPVRMEDNIIITETGFEYITNFSRELIVL